MDKYLWNDLASDYAKSVEDNDDQTIQNYLKKEIEIISELCSKKIQDKKKFYIIDMGSGTGRVLFELNTFFKNAEISYLGIELSEPMIILSEKKKLKFSPDSNIHFLKMDLMELDSKLFEKSSPGSVVMCLYNTIGVLPDSKRPFFVEQMKKIAGPEGLVIISTFNGDDFKNIAPIMYNAMLPMIKKINSDSFDGKNRVFKNENGFRSQWFPKKQIMELLKTELEPIPIEINFDGKVKTFGYVFTNE